MSSSHRKCLLSVEWLLLLLLSLGNNFKQKVFLSAKIFCKNYFQVSWQWHYLRTVHYFYTNFLLEPKFKNVVQDHQSEDSVHLWLEIRCPCTSYLCICDMQHLIWCLLNWNEKWWVDIIKLSRFSVTLNWMSLCIYGRRGKWGEYKSSRCYHIGLVPHYHQNAFDCST